MSNLSESSELEERFERFELVEPVGRGAAAEVWRGRHRVDGECVAIKLLRPESAQFDEVDGQLRHEVQSVAGLRHPNVVAVYDYGVVRGDSGAVGSGFSGRPYFVMELADEGTLDERGEFDTWSSVRRFALQVLDGLSHAHARGVIHRDLKPQNILGFRDRSVPGGIRWKLSDFGLAHAFRPERGEELDELDVVSAGTPYYMAPEQVEADWHLFGPWTDLYSLGCLIWELLTEAPPHVGDGLAEVAWKHVDERPGRFSAPFPVPEALEPWLRRLLAKSPGDRFVTAADAAWNLPDELAEGATETPSGDSPSSNGSPDETGATSIAFAETLHGSEIAEDDVDRGTEGGNDVSVAPTLGDVGARSSSGAASSESGVSNSGASDGAGEVPGERKGVESVEVPPIPDTWSERSHRDRGRRPVGIGLFGLRETPFVDRDEERDRLWRYFKQVDGTGDAHCLLVCGESGTGKSRLVEWMARRLRELGAASTLRARFARHAAPASGLDGMLRNWFLTWGLDREEAWRQIETRLDWFVREQDPSSSVIDLDLGRALLEMVRPSGEEYDVQGPSYHFGSKRDEFVFLRRLLERLGRRRPVFLWLENLAWSRTGVDFLEFLFEDDQSVPAYIVGTVRTDRIEDVPAVDIEELVERSERIDSLNVSSLAPRHQREMIRRLLPIDDELADDIGRRTEGNPLYALQVVNDWIERDVLEIGEEGYELAEEASESVPDDIHKLWLRRIRSILDSFAVEQRDVVLRALEIASVLGRQVDEAEWRQARPESLDTAGSERLVTELVEQGLAERTRGGWSFVHNMLVESLHRTARNEGRWKRHNRACVEAIDSLYPDRVGATGERRGEHAIEAGDYEVALEALLDGVEHARARGRYPKMGELLDRRVEVMEELDLSESDRSRAQNKLLRVEVRQRRRQFDAASELLDELEGGLLSEDWTWECAEAIKLRSKSHFLRGEFEESRRLAESAREMFESCGDDIRVAECLLGIGAALPFGEQGGRAREIFERARETFEAHGDNQMAARCDVQIANTFLDQGDFEEARELLEATLERVEEMGNLEARARCKSRLGEIARYQGDYEEAAELYRSVIDIQQSQQHDADAQISELNLAMTELALERHAAARQAMRRLREEFAESGRDQFQPVFALGLAAANGGVGDWEDWDTWMDEFQRTFDGSDFLYREHPWLAELAAKSAEGAGHRERARRGYRVAERLWRRFGDGAEAEAASAKVERLSHET